MEGKPYHKISDTIWEIPTTFKKGMRVPARIVATEKLLNQMEEEVFDQITNVAHLPGLVKYVLCMPDGHVGYGSPIGGVGATDPKLGGVISPGMIGFDINCGMRLMTTTLSRDDVLPRIEKLVDRLFEKIPAGVGVSGFIKPSKKEFMDVITKGARWAVDLGMGRKEDLDQIEERGEMTFANPEKISDHAVERGLRQIGTLGSGNHYLEVQVVDTIFDMKQAEAWGIVGQNQIVVMFHCGSRGFGHQVATDYLQTFEKKMERYKISVPDRQLACAPFNSTDGQNYYQAMAAACNLAFANRQVITHRVREVFSEVFNKPDADLGLSVVYDVAHNIAKVESFALHPDPVVAGEGSPTNTGDSSSASRRTQNDKPKKLIVHRKGATRAYPNQPVILGGSMQTGSYLLVGTQKAMEETFGSTAHGSGRTMSRAQAKKNIHGQSLLEQMKKEGIYVRSVSFAGLAEEAGFAYKNIHDVVEVLSLSGISTPVASFKPIGNVKG